MSEGLKPCPFCGQAPTVEDADEPETEGSWPTKRAYCYQCEYEGPSAGSSGWNHSDADAIAAWNRRAPDAEAKAQGAAEERAATVKLIRIRAAMARGLVRFGASSAVGDALVGLADEVDTGAHRWEPS